ncbi:MAG: nitroreductase family protein [Rikenellaceae bacterium]
MKRRMLLSILTPLCVGCICVGCLGVSAQSEENQTLKSIYARTSVRAYTSQPVEKELLVELTKVAMAAPSAMNRQPWEFVIIQDRSILDKIGEIKPPVGKAPAAIVVLGNTEVSGSWVLDCSAATENILLAATSMGLGTVWTGAHGNTKFEEMLKETLSLPEGVMPLSVIAVGYADGTPTPKNKYDAKKVYFDKYGN